jgi:Asp-tRNA(Asn)/Glu-tRNA(Gln) amidotransferase B subunit
MRTRSQSTHERQRSASRTNTVSNNAARQVFYIVRTATVDTIIATKGLKASVDTGELKIIDDVLAANAKKTSRCAGGQGAMNALVGQAMKATKAKSQPGVSTSC